MRGWPRGGCQTKLAIVLGHVPYLSLPRVSLLIARRPDPYPPPISPARRILPRKLRNARREAQLLTFPAPIGTRDTRCTRPWVCRGSTSTEKDAMYGRYRRDIRAARPRIPSRHQMGTVGKRRHPPNGLWSKLFLSQVGDFEQRALLTPAQLLEEAPIAGTASQRLERDERPKEPGARRPLRR